MPNAPKDLIVEGKERVIRDKLVTFGKYANQNKLFSDITKEDFPFCLELSKDFKNMRDFYNYVMESDEMIAHEEKEEDEYNKQIEINITHEKGGKKKLNNHKINELKERINKAF